MRIGASNHVVSLVAVLRQLWIEVIDHLIDEPLYSPSHCGLTKHDFIS